MHDKMNVDKEIEITVSNCDKQCQKMKKVVATRLGPYVIH